MRTSTLPFLVLLLAACGEPQPAGPRSDGAPRFAVVRTDYQSTAIALVDAEGEVVDPALLSSGSVKPGLVAALSGDVVLASAERHTEGVLNVIDRFGTDVITRLDVETGAVLGQLRVAPAAGGFSSNPRDLSIVRPDQAFVSRFGVNLSSDAPPSDRGNDLLELDPTTLELTGRRVGLEALTVTATVQTDAGPRAVEVYARPSGLALAGGRLAVGLAALSFDFDAAGPGRVVVVDPQTLALEVLELSPSVRNCGRLARVPGADDRVLVACAGFARPFGDPPQIRASSGVFLVEVGADGARVLASWRPGGSRPLAVNAVLPLSASRFLGVEQGQLGAGGDRLFLVDIETGAAELLLEAAEAFALGRPARLFETGRLLVPDRSISGGGLRRLRPEDGAWVEEAPVSFGDPLPPAAVHRLPETP